MEEDALQFVRERGFHGDPQVLISWFFSGNWVKTEIKDSPLGESLIEG